MMASSALSRTPPLLALSINRPFSFPSRSSSADCCLPRRRASRPVSPVSRSRSSRSGSDTTRRFWVPC